MIPTCGPCKQPMERLEKADQPDVWRCPACGCWTSKPPFTPDRKAS